MKLTQFLSPAVFLVERGYSSPVADKGDVRRAVYRTILDRSRETHGRPTVGSQHGEPYVADWLDCYLSLLVFGSIAGVYSDVVF